MSGTDILTANEQTIQLVTFEVGDIVLGVDISHVQEINRHTEVTSVPQAPPMIHGVVNLRGDVVTVLDPHRIFGIDPASDSAQRRNLILSIGGERIGVLVDRVADILAVHPSDLTRRPSNVRSIKKQFVDSVYLRDEEIVVVVNATQLVDVVDQQPQCADA